MKTFCVKHFSTKNIQNTNFYHIKTQQTQPTPSKENKE